MTDASTQNSFDDWVTVFFVKTLLFCFKICFSVKEKKKPSIYTDTYSCKATKVELQL